MHEQQNAGGHSHPLLSRGRLSRSLLEMVQFLKDFILSGRSLTVTRSLAKTYKGDLKPSLT